MRIEIETNGYWTDTIIKFNGIQQDNLKELNFGIKVGCKAKLQMIKDIQGSSEFMSYFGGDFQRYDENHPEK